MKPAEHPDFFRVPPPEGRSRESTIRLDREGRFSHEGVPVEHPKLSDAMHTWIGRHPDNGRYILNNGYDWTYFTVEDAPFTVRSLRMEGDRILLCLSDGSSEPWRTETTHLGSSGSLYAKVKHQTPGGPFEARFSRHAQTMLAPFLIENDGKPALSVRGALVHLPI